MDDSDIRQINNKKKKKREQNRKNRKHVWYNFIFKNCRLLSCKEYAISITESTVPSWVLYYEFGKITIIDIHKWDQIL